MYAWNINRPINREHTYICRYTHSHCKGERERGKKADKTGGKVIAASHVCYLSKAQNDMQIFSGESRHMLINDSTTERDHQIDEYKYVRVETIPV